MEGKEEIHECSFCLFARLYSLMVLGIRYTRRFKNPDDQEI